MWDIITDVNSGEVKMGNFMQAMVILSLIIAVSAGIATGITNVMHKKLTNKAIQEAVRELSQKT